MAIYAEKLRLSEKEGNKSEIIFALGGISTTYSRMRNNKKALEYELKKLKLIQENAKDSIEVAWEYTNVGQMYYNLYDHKSANLFYLKSYKILGDKIEDRKKIMQLFLIARSFNEMKDNAKAREYFFKALGIADQLKSPQIMGVINSEIGQTYFYEKNYAKALEYKLKGLELIKYKTDGDAFLPFLTTGQVYLALKQYDLAEKNVLNANKIAEDRKDFHNQKAVAKLMTDIYKGKGNIAKANEFSILYYQLKDSMDRAANAEEMLYKELNYENEKKETYLKAEQEKQNSIHIKEKEKQQIVTYAISAGLILMGGFAVFVIISLRKSRKANKIIEQQKHLVEEKHKEITDSINYAERIQRSFLATKELLDTNLKDHFVFFQPKDVVSGDFYWATKLSNGNFALVTADSTGHGVPGAIMSILNISCLENSVKDGILHPSEILNHTRISIIDRLKKDGSEQGGKDGMDASLICFDFKNSKFTYSAANNPIWVIRPSKGSASAPELIELHPDKMPVGKHDRDFVPFTQHEFELQKGDMVYALTDGMPDQFGGPKGKKFMYKKLKEYLVSISTDTMDTQKQKLRETFQIWKGDLEQVDDVCLIGIKI